MLCCLCCAHLVRSARPLRMAQEAMLCCIDRQRSAPTSAPTRAAVLQALKAMDVR